MNNDLNIAFQTWLDRATADHQEIIDVEIENRFAAYPALQECLTSRPIAVDALRKRLLAPELTSTTDLKRYARTEFDLLLADTGAVSEQIARLIDYLPEANDEVISRINDFVENGKQRSKLAPHFALTVASLILTLVHPTRFVDFPSRTTWVEFAQALGYGIVENSASYGEKLIWASDFATALTETAVFQDAWGNQSNRAMWIVGALNWAHHRITKIEQTS